MYIEEKSFKDRSLCIKNLIDKCTEIIERHKYSDEDIRTITFANIRGLAYPAIGITNLLDSWANGEDKIKGIIPLLLGMTTLDQKSVTLMGDSMASTTKLGLIALAQFQIENFINCITKTLGIQASKQGFYDKASNLISFLKIEIQKAEELNVPALIRNSLHSNGIHSGYKGRDSEINIQEVLYSFLHGKKVSCASITHITHALENSLEILDEIIDHPEVKKHTEEISDEYRLQTK